MGFVEIVGLFRLVSPVVEYRGALVRLLRRVTNSPFAKECRLIASTLKSTGNRLAKLLWLEHEKEILDPVASGILTRQKIGAVDRTDGRVHETVFENQRRSCKSIEIGSLNRLIPSIADSIVPLIIGEDHHDVGRSISCETNWIDQKSEREQLKSTIHGLT